MTTIKRPNTVVKRKTPKTVGDPTGDRNPFKDSGVPHLDMEVGKIYKYVERKARSVLTSSPFA